MRGALRSALLLAVALAACGQRELDPAPEGGSGGGGPGGAGGGAGHGAGAGAGSDAGARDASPEVSPAPRDASPSDGGVSGLGVVLVPNVHGVVDGTNAAGVAGAWYAYADGYADGSSVSGGGSCQLAGHSDCSTFITPTPGISFLPSASGAMCAAGHAALVPAVGTTFDYAAVYGAAIGLDFNNPAGTKLPYDAVDRPVPFRGMAFDIDTPPTNALRVELPTSAVPGHTDADPAYWGGGTMNASPVRVGHNMFLWRDIGGPMYLTNPAAFDPTKLTAIRFHVITNMNAPIDFSFCVSNLTMLW